MCVREGQLGARDSRGLGWLAQIAERSQIDYKRDAKKDPAKKDSEHAAGQLRMSCQRSQEPESWLLEVVSA